MSRRPRCAPSYRRRLLLCAGKRDRLTRAPADQVAGEISPPTTESYKFVPVRSPTNRRSCPCDFHAVATRVYDHTKATMSGAINHAPSCVEHTTPLIRICSHSSAVLVCTSMATTHTNTRGRMRRHARNLARSRSSPCWDVRKCPQSGGRLLLLWTIHRGRVYMNASLVAGGNSGMGEPSTETQRRDGPRLGNGGLVGGVVLCQPPDGRRSERAVCADSREWRPSARKKAFHPA